MMLSLKSMSNVYVWLHICLYDINVYIHIALD